jgi:hypothetical protein
MIGIRAHQRKAFGIFKFFHLLAGLFWFSAPQYAAAQKMTSEQAFRVYFQDHKDSLDELEGIWSVSTIQEFFRYDTLYDVMKYPKPVRVAIMNKGDHYDTFILTGEPYHVEFRSSDVTHVYVYKNYYKETDSYSKANATITKGGKMQISYEFPEKYLRYKFSDSYEEGTRVMNNTSWQRVFPESK